MTFEDKTELSDVLQNIDTDYLLNHNLNLSHHML